MIANYFLDFLAAAATVLTGFLPADPPPLWVSDGGRYLSIALDYGNGLGAWVPWHLVGQVVAACFVCLAVGFSIRVVRIIMSFFTLGGGSAG